MRGCSSFSCAYGVGILLGLGTLACPAVASANGVRQLELSATSEDVVIRVAADARLEQPQVKYDRGTIKMWFPQVDEDRRVSVVGDGEMIRRVRVRPGAQGSALLRVDLGDKRRLDPGTVRVHSHPTGAVVSIPRNVLPSAAPTVPEAAQPAEAPAPAEVRPVHKSAPASASDDSTARATLAGVAALGKERRQGLSSGDDGSEATQPEKAGAAQPSLAKADAETETAVAAAVGISLALVAVLAAVRFWNFRRKSAAPLANIEVIGARRLGTRHQLVLVRALGEDHLLCMHGERTERLASTPSPGTQADAIKMLPSLTQEERSPLSVVERAERVDRERPSGPAPRKLPEESPGVDRDTPFGSELLHFMAKRSHPTWRPGARSTEPPVSMPSPSPSVAGLLRLREREAS